MRGVRLVLEPTNQVKPSHKSATQTSVSQPICLYFILGSSCEYYLYWVAINVQFKWEMFALFRSIKNTQLLVTSRSLFIIRLTSQVTAAFLSLSRSVAIAIRIGFSARFLGYCSILRFRKSYQHLNTKMVTEHVAFCHQVGRTWVELLTDMIATMIAARRTESFASLTVIIADFKLQWGRMMRMVFSGMKSWESDFSLYRDTDLTGFPYEIPKIFNLAVKKWTQIWDIKLGSEFELRSSSLVQKKSANFCTHSIRLRELFMYRIFTTWE